MSEERAWDEGYHAGLLDPSKGITANPYRATARTAPVVEGYTPRGPYVVTAHGDEALVVRRPMTGGGGHVDVAVGAACAFPVAYERAGELNRAYEWGVEHAAAAAAGHVRQLEADVAEARALITEASVRINALLALVRGATP